MTESGFSIKFHKCVACVRVRNGENSKSTMELYHGAQKKSAEITKIFRKRVKFATNLQIGQKARKATETNMQNDEFLFAD